MRTHEVPRLIRACDSATPDSQRSSDLTKLGLRGICAEESGVGKTTELPGGRVTILGGTVVTLALSA